MVVFFHLNLYNTTASSSINTPCLSVCLPVRLSSPPSVYLVHYIDVIMGAMLSQITGLMIVYSTVYSAADKKTSKLRVTGLCAGNSPVIGEFPAQMASNAENISLWWRHHGLSLLGGTILATFWIDFIRQSIKLVDFIVCHVFPTAIKLMEKQQKRLHIYYENKTSIVQTRTLSSYCASCCPNILRL